MRATFSWLDKAIEKLCRGQNCESTRIVRSVSLFRFGKARAFSRGLPFALGEKTCGTRFEHW
jgi:hypothetical protein